MEAVKYITTILKWIALVLACVLLIGMVAGYRLYILESDSMSPKYPKGSMVMLDSKARASDIELDDVIGLMVGDSLVFHRVVHVPSDSTVSTAEDESRIGLADENSGYIIAGDRDPDNWTDVEISNSNLLGKLVMAVPGLGGMAGLFIGRSWIGWVAGMLVMVVALVPWNRVGKKAENG